MKNRKNFAAAVCLLIAFALWTLAVNFVDVQMIGPRESSVGFATINRFVHDLTGVHLWLYTITDWLGLVPVGVAMAFAVLGLCQWIRRKQIWKVDFNILILGGFYLAVIAVYMFFEEIVVNYRPVLMNGYLEASYPSSTTILVLCVMTTAMMQLQERIKNSGMKKWVTFIISAYIAFMVIGRLVSGVHWFSDIVGGILLSAGLVLLYHAIIKLK